MIELYISQNKNTASEAYGPSRPRAVWATALSSKKIRYDSHVGRTCFVLFHGVRDT